MAESEEPKAAIERPKRMTEVPVSPQGLAALFGNAGGQNATVNALVHMLKETISMLQEDLRYFRTRCQKLEDENERLKHGG